MTDAIVDPSTVMIEPIHASIAYFTVPRSIFNIAFTSLTVKALLKIFDDLIFITVTIYEHNRISRIDF
jgi:hypothetical protein